MALQGSELEDIFRRSATRILSEVRDLSPYNDRRGSYQQNERAENQGNETRGGEIQPDN